MSMLATVLNLLVDGVSAMAIRSRDVTLRELKKGSFSAISAAA